MPMYPHRLGVRAHNHALAVRARAWLSCSKLIRQTRGIQELEWINNLARAFQVSLLAYSPLGQGYLTGKYENGALPPGSRRS